MTPPDEVLRKMAEAAGYAEFITCDAATCNGMCEAPEVHFAPAIQRALTAAAECGWKLVPVEATGDIRAIGERGGGLRRAGAGTAMAPGRHPATVPGRSAAATRPASYAPGGSGRAGRYRSARH